MKKLLVLLMILCSCSAFAQDVIVKNDGSTVLCRIVEVNSSEVVYKKWNNLNGSNYVMNRSDVANINYENGKKENVSSNGTNLYTPGNQNSGAQQYNDRALLAIDKASDIPSQLKKAKTQKLVGWIGGGILVAGGGLILAILNSTEEYYGYGYYDDVANVPAIIAGSACVVGGAAWTYFWTKSARHIKQRCYENYSLYQQEFKFSNGSSLMTGVDVIRDNMNGSKAFGLGLRYNF